jgi:hypothetical protein
MPPVPSITPQQNVQLRQQVRFSGIQEFAQALSPKKPNLEAISQNLPLLFDKLDLTPVLTGMDTSERVRFLNAVTHLHSQVKDNLPLGTLEKKIDPADEKEKWFITSFDNEDGSASVTRFETVKRNKVFGPETDMKTFLTEALGPGPRLIIGPAGWTIPNPDVLINNNPQFKKKADQLKVDLVEALGKDNPNFEKLYTKGVKQLASEAYEEAFRSFWGPIQKYLIEEAGLDPSKLAFLTSASYSGIDKAAMDFADANNIDVVNVTPYRYAEWMDTSKSYPLLITNSVDDYADKFAQGATFLFITGGREHALRKDAANFMFEQNKAVIAVDIMKETLGFDVPSLLRGVVDNAARLLNEMGFSVKTAGFAQNVKSSNKLTQSQKEVAGAIETLYKQMTFTDTRKIAQNLAK